MADTFLHEDGSLAAAIATRSLTDDVAALNTLPQDSPRTTVAHLGGLACNTDNINLSPPASLTNANAETHQILSGGKSSSLLQEPFGNGVIDQMMVS